MLCFAPSPYAQEAGPAVGDRPVVMMGGMLKPQAGGVQTTSGRIDPLKGLIRTFGGDLGPFVGRIRTFAGDVDPYKGLIRTFEGDVDPYKGLIRTFWGDLTPALGDLDPSVGRIRTFSDGFLPQSRETMALWQSAEVSGDYSAVVAQLRTLEQDAATQWGDAVMQRTGKNFAGGFSEGFFAKWGIDLSDQASLAGWEPFDRQRFLLDWYDNVLAFSGMDRVDHWMNAVNWSPMLTQTQGGGSRAVIGLVDFFVANDADVRSKVIYAGGYEHVNNAHGAAVGSLIVASHDGQGIMGIAPRAQVAAFNPFDNTLTASWFDVRRGIIQVGQRGASVINLSLGVPGYTLHADWREVFTTAAIDKFKDSTVYVIAAGNEGVAQTRNINMAGALESTFILVGSVDANGRISAFSNTPGIACLTDGDTCGNTQIWTADNKKFERTDYLKESGLLMNRFLVAPGEMILVSDGEGGVTRMSGTSFAAPLVSGAIALIHDRWPWLKQEPRAVAKIILESAQDLGAPGVDPVYGHGLLDIEASQSPLDFKKLSYYLAGDRSLKKMSISTLKGKGFDPVWATNDMHFVAFEKIDRAERDFLIPLSSRLFNSGSSAGNFQEYLYDRFTAWLNGSSYTVAATGFSDAGPAANINGPAGWSISMRGRHETFAIAGGGQRMRLRSSVEMFAPSRGFSLGFGSGDGAIMLGGSPSLQMSSDFDPALGGVNPLLGFASGDAHVAARVGLGSDFDLTFGVTRQDRSIDQDLASEMADPSDHALLHTLGDYEAQATTLRLDYRPASAVTLSASLTRLEEQGAFFGVRSLEREDFGAGTVSDGLTFAADGQLGEGFSLFASGTASMSSSKGDAVLGVEDTLATAFQLGVAKHQVFGSSDRLRLSLAQPLTVERGTMNMRMIGVIDRETGEKGLITQRIDIGAPEQRRYRVEALYGTPMLQGLGELNLFGSAELREVRSDIPGFAAGGSFRLAF